MAQRIPDLIHYHAPRTRSVTIRWMFEELGIQPELRLLNLQKGEHKSAGFLAINPMGKVPAVVHKDVVITETPAICSYLADAFPAARLAPAMDDPARGRYFRAMFFYAACVEPAASDRAFKNEAAPSSMLGYGSYESMLEGLKDIIGTGPFVLGERFTAADVMLGAGVGYLRDFQLLPADPEFTEYVERVRSRPAHQRAMAEEAGLLEQLASRS